MVLDYSVWSGGVPKMGDGTYSSGITLQTQCFTLKEIVLIINVLLVAEQPTLR